MSGGGPPSTADWPAGAAYEEDLALLSEGDAAIVDELVEDSRGAPGALGAILGRLNESLGFVSPPIQEALARRLAVPSVIVQQVVSFDPDLSSHPPSGPAVRLCGGAACLLPHGLGVHRAAGAEASVLPCLGACWGAPIAEEGSSRYEELTPLAARELGAGKSASPVRRHRPPLRGAPASLWRQEDLQRVRQHVGERVARRAQAAVDLGVRELLVCNGSGCSVRAADRVAEVISRSLAERGADLSLRVVRVGCRGGDLGMVTVAASPTGWRVRGVDEARAAALVAELCRDRSFTPSEAVWPGDDGAAASGVLRRCGVVDPCSLEEYVASGGFRSLERVVGAGGGLARSLARVEASGLSLRDEEGQPLGRALVAASAVGVSTVLCPCVSSEGHLVADSLLLGGDPFAVIEGVILTGLLCGARQGVVMPPSGALHLVEQVELAVALARRRGLLGPSILGGGLSFEMTVVPLPRRLVAIDESALRRCVLGEGTLTPAPRAVADGLPPALVIDPESAARLGAVLGMPEDDPGKARLLAGLRLVTLVGHLATPAVVEVPAATTLEGLLQVSAVPAPGIAAPVKGALSGGLLGVFQRWGREERVASRGSVLLLGESTCVVALLASLLSTLVREACGACAPGRTGVRALHEAFAAMAEGRLGGGSLAAVEETAAHLRATARCELGRGAGRLVASALGAFRAEIEAHLVDGRCPTGHCRRMVAG